MSPTQPDATKGVPGSVRQESTESRQFRVTMDNLGDYEFRVSFDKESYGALLMDEPPPLGKDRGPNASRILAAAVGNCLSASLLFCARKSRIDVKKLQTEVTVQYTRNEQGRLRIGRMEVVIDPVFESAEPTKARRCLELFEDYCVVTQSVRKGIDVAVSIKSPTA